MPSESRSHAVARRAFVKGVVSTGAWCGLGCPGLRAAAAPQQEAEEGGVHKFQADSKMTFEQVFRFAFQSSYIPVMKVLEEELGPEELQAAAAEAVARQMEAYGKRVPRNDLATFVTPFKRPSPLFDHAITLEVVEDTERAVELKVTECLWAKTFRDAGEADLGFRCVCFADYGAVEAFNPRLKMIRDKTLMQGHDCCNHRYVVEE